MFLEHQVKFINTSQDIRLNFENAQIIKSNNSIFLLHGIDLYAVNVEKINPKIIGRLDGIDNQTVSDIEVSHYGVRLFS